jgi:hypothetical protein
MYGDVLRPLAVNPAHQFTETGLGILQRPSARLKAARPAAQFRPAVRPGLPNSTNGRTNLA